MQYYQSHSPRPSEVLYSSYQTDVTYSLEPKTRFPISLDWQNVVLVLEDLQVVRESELNLQLNVSIKLVGNAKKVLVTKERAEKLTDDGHWNPLCEPLRQVEYLEFKRFFQKRG